MDSLINKKIGLKMLNLFVASAIIFVLLPVFFSCTSKAQSEPTPLPSPTPMPTIFPAFPEQVTFQGENFGEVTTVLIFFDLADLSQKTTVNSSEFTFTQVNSGKGIIKIINKQNREILESFTLNEAGKKEIASLTEVIKNWISNPQNNYGIILQVEELSASDQITFDGMQLTIDYVTADETPPEILDLQPQLLSPNSFQLDFTANEPVTAYIEYGKTSLYDQVSAKSVEYSDTGSVILEDLLANTTYHYKLIISDESGNRTSTLNQTILTIAGEEPIFRRQTGTVPLEAPRVLNKELVRDGSGYRIDLAWTKMDAEQIDGYILYRSVNQEDFSEYNRISKDSNRFSDLNLDNGRTYSYYVIAYRGSELSKKSPTQVVEIPDFSGGILGLNDLARGGLGVDSLMIIAGVAAIVVGFLYFLFKKFQRSLQLNKLNKKRRLKNVFYDPSYYSNEYEKMVVD